MQAKQQNVFEHQWNLGRGYLTSKLYQKASEYDEEMPQWRGDLTSKLYQKANEFDESMPRLYYH